MFRIKLIPVLVLLLIISLSAQTGSADKKEKKAVQDSSVTLPSRPKKKSSQQKWVQSVLTRVEKEKVMDSVQAESKDTNATPYELMKAQNRDKIPLLVIRPVSKFGVGTLKNKWLLFLCEDLIHFRLGAIPALDIVSPAKLADMLPAYDDYKHAISVEKYKEAAQELSVPYLLYLQCSYTHLGKKVTFLGDIISIKDDKSVFTVSNNFPLKDLGTVLSKFVLQMVEKMGIEPGKQNSNFLTTPITSSNTYTFRMIGEYCARDDKRSAKYWEAFKKEYKHILEKDPDMILGYYSAAKLCGAEKKYKMAAGFSYGLINRLGHSYPPAYLATTRYYRLARRYTEAMQVAELASVIPEIQKPLQEEKALIEQENVGKK